MIASQQRRKTKILTHVFIGVIKAEKAFDLGPKAGKLIVCEKSVRKLKGKP